MRLFIASPVRVDDYPALMADFSAILEGKWVEEENLHLTWIFLGTQNSPEPIIKKMRALPPLQEAYPLTGLGTFDHPPRILFARSHERILYDRAREFRKRGFDLTRFTPHVTLCRIKKIRNYKRFKELKKDYEEKILGEIVPEIALYESVLTKERAYYKKIESVTK